MPESLTVRRNTTLYTVNGAAEALGLDPSRVHRLCKSRGVGTYLGRQLVLTAGELAGLQERTPGWPKGRPRAVD